MRALSHYGPWCLLILFSLSTWASDRDSALMVMVETERAFSKRCLAIGQKDATMEAMAEDGVLFRPGPIKAKKMLGEAKPIPLMLSFEPEFADMAASGDFGYTSGPWEFRTSRPLTPPIEYGYYATIWKKQPDGQFRVAVAMAVDIGEAMPRDYQYSLSYPTSTPLASAVEETTDPQKANQMLLACDEASSEEWRAEPRPENYLKYLTPGARLYRKDIFPTTSRNQIRQLLAAAKNMTWKPMRAEVAKSGDLGYSYGVYQAGKGEGAVQGHYLRFWKRQANDQWRVVVDLHKPNGSF